MSFFSELNFYFLKQNGTIFIFFIWCEVPCNKLIPYLIFSPNEHSRSRQFQVWYWCTLYITYVSVDVKIVQSLLSIKSFSPLRHEFADPKICVFLVACTNRPFVRHSSHPSVKFFFNFSAFTGSYNITAPAQCMVSLLL